jgi:hypothetical protein
LFLIGCTEKGYVKLIGGLSDWGFEGFDGFEGYEGYDV